LNVVVDAQVIGWYLAELRGATTPATHPPSALIDSLSVRDIAFLDEGAQIESEWRRTTDPEWFDQWFGDLLARGGAVIIPVRPASALLRTLQRDYGFPRSRDAWYINTAAAANTDTEAVAIVSEDLDFYEPRAKRGCTPARRIRIISQASGNVARYLRREAGIEVQCLASHCT
jgi:hypothetical protein